MNFGVIKAIGYGATAIGMGATLVSNWVDDKKMEEQIEKKVNEALANKEKKDGKES